MPLAAGAHLGPYEILSPLGAGGMGEAGDQLFSTPVKTAPALSPGEPRALLRIDRPSASASESHDIYDVTPDGKRFIVLVQQKDSTKGARIDVILNFGRSLK